MLARKRYRHRLWIDMPTGEFGHSQPSSIDPWVLGALLGDGSISGKTLSFTAAESEMVERMEARIPAEVRLRRHKGSAYDWTLTREHAVAGGSNRPGWEPHPLLQAVRELGLWGKHSYEKFIPRVFLDASRDTRLSLLQGLLDTDGW
jgi:replicative DNA helicase